MKATLHPIRATALAKYNTAHAAWVASTNQKDEAVYLAADRALEAARRELVDAESAHPTAKELAKRTARLTRSNRGLQD